MHQTEPSWGELSFELLAEIAVGATARVELCRVVEGPLEGAFVAVKRLHPHIADDPQFVDMFRDEVWMSASLKHPNVVEVMGWGQDSIGPWLAVEFVRGVSLQRLMKTVFETGERFTERMVVYIARCICDGLAEAHALRSASGEHLNLVHRDLTPGNVLLGFEGQVKITDFGLAKAKQRLTKTLTGLLKGQPQYMSPEQVNGKPLDGRSDVFALGVVLFELFSGRRPWNATTDLDAMRAITDDPPADLEKLRPRIDRALVDLVERCLHKDPAQRWQSADELKARLDEWLQVHGYRNDNHVSLARFVRRNAMRQMRWFERALAGELAGEAQANQPHDLQMTPPPPAPVDSGSGSEVSLGEEVDWGDEGPTLIQMGDRMRKAAQAHGGRPRAATGSDTHTRRESRRLPRPADEEPPTQRTGDKARRGAAPTMTDIIAPAEESGPGELGEIGQRVRSLFAESRFDPHLGMVAPPDPDVPPLPPAPRRRRELPRLTDDESVAEVLTKPETPAGVRVRPASSRPVPISPVREPREAGVAEVGRGLGGLGGLHRDKPISANAPFPSELWGMPAPKDPSEPAAEAESDLASEARRMGEAAKRASGEAERAGKIAEARARAAGLAGEAALLAAAGERPLALRKLREAQGIEEAIDRGELPLLSPVRVESFIPERPFTPAPEVHRPVPAWLRDGTTVTLLFGLIVLLAVLLLVALVL